jgi:ubiquinone/menaquinone biosynthesis C-methylase UbiE
VKGKPSPRFDEVQTVKLLREYGELAASYDKRWSAYLDASMRMTLELLPEQPFDRELDLGCGTGQLLQLLAGRPGIKTLLGIDRVPEMLQVAQQRLGQRATILQGDAGQLPCEDACFELVTTTNALHYFPDVDAALCEIRRVMSQNGHLLITDWCRDYYWMRLLNLVLPWSRHAHVHTLSLDELEQCLNRAGFSITRKGKSKIDWFWGLMSVHARPI